jgi:hypothetical protein
VNHLLGKSNDELGSGEWELPKGSLQTLWLVTSASDTQWSRCSGRIGSEVMKVFALRRKIVRDGALQLV